ncbi:MFS transporter [Clavibacter sp. CT19]|uniref:MFS transporter n=1 Tax=Clavibacter sp. CT19 TaxID=3018990 RepID=UPI0022EA8E20|nr:MFS transporter [Clavibacter sp. CT19]MDA3804378.1 MFS transporter [Clavibacter sp. CT19]
MTGRDARSGIARALRTVGAGHLAAWSALPRPVRVLIAARSVNRLGAATLPFLAVVLTGQMGASVAAAGAVVALFGAATIPSRLLGGRLADAVGRRTAIVTGLVLTAVCQLALAAAPDLRTAAVAAVLLGLSFELYEPASQALVADLVEGDGDRVAAYGMLAACLAAAGVVAGVLATAVGGVDLRLLFVADAASCLACAALVRLGLPAPAAGPRGSADRAADSRTRSGAADGGAMADDSAARSPWRDPVLLGMLASGTGFAILYLQLDVLLPLTLAARGTEPSRAGLLFALSALVVVLGQPLLRSVPLSRLRPGPAMALGFALLGTGFAVTGSAGGPLGLAAAAVVWSVGDLLLLGRAPALVVALAPVASRARYLSAYGVSWGIAAMVGPLLGTQLLARIGVAGTWVALGLGGVALALVQPLVVRRVAARSIGRRAGRSADQAG